MTVGLVAAAALGVALSAAGEEKPFDTITCPLILGETTEPTDAHADEIIAAVRANVEKLLAADPQAVPMAFWDCDGTILNGDISLGLYDRSPEHRKLYRGLLEEAIVAGYSKILRGEEGWREFRDVHHPFFAKLGRWIAGPYNAQLFAGAKVAELDAFCEQKTKGEISDWFFASSIKMLRALAEMGVENYVVSAGPASLVRNVMPALGLSRDRFVGTPVREVCGRWTDEAIRPAPDGEGKVENVRQIILSRPNGVVVAGFGNSYKTDGPFLKYIRSQRLPGGGEGVSVMINGGKPGAYAGLFRCVNQRRCLRDWRSAMPAFTRLSAAADGRALKVEPVRCSKMPFNRRWPGHQRPKDQTEICGLARFTLTKPTEVELQVNEPFSRVAVRPLSKGVKPVVDGRRIRFTVATAGQYTVEIDGWHRNLFLFADPPEAYDVDRSDPKVRWFGPGEHDVGLLELKSGETVYLAEGAVVYGRIHARDADDIRILGRGILDASRVKETVIRNDPAKDAEELKKGFAVGNVKRYDTIRLEYCDRVKIDGIVIRDSQIYNIRPICCRDLEICNVKAIGSWRYNADGFDLHNCERVTIRDSFVRTYDDAICIKGLDCWMKESDMNHDGYCHDVFRDVLVSNVVTWCDWGLNYEIGAETRAREIANVRFVDCDAIRASSGVCDVQSVDWADIHDITYENIRVELDGEWMAPQMQDSDDQKYVNRSDGKYGGKLLSSRVYQHPEYSAGGTRRGNNHRILYKDIFVTGGDERLKCAFIGSSAASRTYDVTIDGVYRNGRRLESAQDLTVVTNAFGSFSFRSPVQHQHNGIISNE